ncbi:hypothetical protein [Pandoraea sp.]|uniref:hypothetical protein n=1 Tax=Pandoraea sp. TaxID=1883445 RepID=UPI0011FC2644|nr:hypothetical protein [Pandoraea sp.]TAL54382.1 MAG: hypothetical protein EPN80_11470 [Pandoraea sp.]TAM17432.1 MAG: hypothetical protein EPN65_10580 [Pandoraea sp.]
MSSRFRLANFTTTSLSAAANGFFSRIMVLMPLYPIGRILTRICLSPLRSVVALILLLNLVGLWLLTFIKWPAGLAEHHSML